MVLLSLSGVHACVRGNGVDRAELSRAGDGDADDLLTPDGLRGGDERMHGASVRVLAGCALGAGKHHPEVCSHVLRCALLGRKSEPEPVDGAVAGSARANGRSLWLL